MRRIVGKKITIERIVEGTSTGPYAGPYVLLITASESIISSHKVVMESARNLAKAGLPVTVTVTETEGKNGFAYFNLE